MFLHLHPAGHIRGAIAMPHISSTYETFSRPYSGGAFFEVEETITHYDSRAYVRHVVRHPGGVAVVAMLGQHAICIEQYRPAVEKMVLEVPAGRPKADETPVDTGTRELIEETGYRPTSMTFIARFYNAPCFCDGATEVFLADVSSQESHRPPAEDLPTHLRFIDLNDVESLMAAGELTDAKTIIALLIARDRRAAKNP